jgi:hypothetical protein
MVLRHRPVGGPVDAVADRKRITKRANALGENAQSFSTPSSLTLLQERVAELVLRQSPFDRRAGRCIGGERAATCSNGFDEKAQSFHAANAFAQDVERTAEIVLRARVQPKIATHLSGRGQ